MQILFVIILSLLAGSGLFFLGYALWPRSRTMPHGFLAGVKVRAPKTAARAEAVLDPTGAETTQVLMTDEQLRVLEAARQAQVERDNLDARVDQQLKEARRIRDDR